MRAFVAFDVPPIEGPVPPWLKPEKHVTLHFFEELSEVRLPAVVEAMEEAARGALPFTVEIHGVGAFPNAQHPRVIWAGLGEGSEAVISLEERLRKALSTRGFSVEHRQFIPHLTLARIRSATATVDAQRFLIESTNVARTWTRLRLTDLKLKESELLPEGARHTIREIVSLEPRP
jgi:RNA 2',3'-cyclic 3'-phosphodiesterase